MMLSSQSIFIFILTLLLLSACSITKQAKTEEFFHTKIHADGSKRFTFTLVLLQDQRKDNTREQYQKRINKPSKGEGSRRGKQGGASNNQANSKRKNNDTEKITILFEKRIQAQLANSQYCREGYITLDSGFNGALYTLRGECNESATDEDRKHFP